ncbi:AraC family transcriptional regulator [Paenibacillus mesotrionivorans]|jgi:AraC-like DNA-binding protein|uniref:AraC family transcriptional regulator n=1 Tax=Paenibacillus mesotrionivorans TaxID=3160968 RepID=A0ACC7P3P7_9BACL
MDHNIFVVLTDTELKLPFFVTSAGGWEHQDNMLREGGFPDFQWIQCISGEGILETEGKRFAVSAGQGMLLYPNRKHHYYAVREPWATRWISFNGVQAEGMLASLKMNASAVLQLSHPDIVLQKLLEANELLQSKDPSRYIRCSALIYAIVLDLFMYSSTPDMRSRTEHYEQLMPALSYIDEHFMEPLTLETLSSQLRISPQYTCHLFQKSFGLRPFEYINRFRLRRAKELLLRHPEVDVKDIARAVGYEHASYFIKLFKQQEGVTPSAFRKVHRQ